MAWLLLALMLTFPHLYESYKAEAWPAGWREAAMLYHITLGSMLPLVMFLFGRFFPEPFAPRSSFDRIWRTLQWSLAVPFTVFALIGAVESVIGLSNYRAAWAIERRTHPLDGVMQVAVYILISSFFAALGTKYGKSHSPDARRRLRIFYWGATVAWTPGLIVTVYARLQGKSLPDVFPQWAILAALAPLVLFPLTLAYVIVVHKAMGVGVALRQGLQYAFAKNGVRALQLILVVAVAFAAVEILGDPSHGRLLKVGVILVGIILVLRIRKFADQLRAWLDRRFFREAYDSEQVLSELSEQVRTMNVQGQPADAALHIKVGKHFTPCHRLPENEIEFDVDEWVFALGGESCPHKLGVGRPLTLFETHTSKICAIKGTRCAAGRTGSSYRLARKWGKCNAGTEYGGPGQHRVDRDVPAVRLLCRLT